MVLEIRDRQGGVTRNRTFIALRIKVRTLAYYLLLTTYEQMIVMS